MSSCRATNAKPSSWRGIYAEVAFIPANSVTVESMLKNARSAIGPTFKGWKGGDYTYSEWTDVHVADEGDSDDTLGEVMFSLGVAFGRTAP